MANQTIWRKKVRSLRITCVRGAAWITWEGSEDHVLESGQSMEIRRVRRFLVELLRGGQVIVEEKPSDAARLAPGASVTSRALAVRPFSAF